MKTNTTNGTLIYVYQPISVNVVDEGRKKGGNAMGFERINQQWLGLTTGWDTADDDSVGNKVAMELGSQLDAHVMESGGVVSYQFMNDAGADQDVMSSYGAENHQRLRSVAKKYDPTGVFQRLEPGGYKLFRNTTNTLSNPS